MFFITKQDPNYTVKGSRDPLGFQVIWQAAGRQLIPHLSTVSGNIKDFQILSTAHFYKNEFEMEDSVFDAFFILFEQLMAYTRYSTYGNEGFNGIDRVKKVFTGSIKEVKISHQDQILSNQKAYGIWGKYIRPFTDMGFKESNLFDDIYNEKAGNNADLERQVSTLRKKGVGETSVVSLQKLPAFASILSKPEALEKELYVSKLLNDHCEGELLNIFSVKPTLKKLSSFYELLAALDSASPNPRFKAVLQFIYNTEKVLSPLSRIFRYLQTSSFWKRTEIESNEYIGAWRSSVDTSGFSTDLKGLAELFNLSNWDLVQGLVQRNENVCAGRGSAPWIRVSASGIEMNHFEGAFFREDYDPGVHCDNTYFFNTYINLHNKLN